MWAIRFFHPVLEALDRGNVIRTAVVYALRILGALTVLSGIFMLVEILKISFQLPTQGTVGGVLFALIFVVAIAAVTQILFYRADTVRDLGESPFTIIPIFSILFRTLGETFATWGVAMGLGGCLFVWVSGRNPVEMLPGLGQMLPTVSGGTFVDGLMFLVWTALASFAALVIFYFLAESTLVIVDIARNVRLLTQPGAAGNEAKKAA
jgi:hypothetical protein